MTLDQLFRKTVELHSARKALTFPGFSLTYGELGRWVRSLAHCLSQQGIAQGDCIGILLGNCPDLAAVYLAATSLGAAAVPLNTFLKSDEIRALLEDSGCRILVTSSDFGDLVAPIQSSLGNLKAVISVDTGDERYVTAQSAARCDARQEILEDDSLPATIIYTSGTTGRPKGVVLTHRNLVSNTLACGDVFPITHADRFLLFLPMFHSFSLTVNMLLPLSVGARIAICPSVKPFGRLIRRILTERITIIAAVPAFYDAISRTRMPGLSLVFRSLRFCVSGSAPMSSETLERFESRFGMPILEGYGLSEAAPVVSVNPYEGRRKPGSVGLPLPGVKVKIISDEEFADPDHDSGEIVISGPNVMEGYLRMPEETGEVLKQGWLHTGDIGYLDGDGYLHIIDRKKDLILHKGMNIYPRDIETVLAQHPSIEEAAVIGKPHPSHGEVPAAYVRLREDTYLTEDEVKNLCREKLACYKIPRYVSFVDEFPRTPTGKILKRKLREI